MAYVTVSTGLETTRGANPTLGPLELVQGGRRVYPPMQRPDLQPRGPAPVPGGWTQARLGWPAAHAATRAQPAFLRPISPSAARRRVSGLGAKAGPCQQACYDVYRRDWVYCRNTYGTNRTAYWDCIHAAESRYFACTGACGLSGMGEVISGYDFVVPQYSTVGRLEGRSCQGCGPAGLGQLDLGSIPWTTVGLLAAGGFLLWKLVGAGRRGVTGVRGRTRRAGARRARIAAARQELAAARSSPGFFG